MLNTKIDFRFMFLFQITFFIAISLQIVEHLFVFDKVEIWYNGHSIVTLL